MWYTTEKKIIKKKEKPKPKEIWWETAGNSDKTAKDGKEIRN